MVGFEQYGGKRGYLDHARSRLLYSLGAYREAERIDWVAINRLVFVCKGNICRSPYAAERARILGVPAVSCGLEAKVGTAADPAAVRNANPRNVDLAQHRSSICDTRQFREADLVIVFEPWQFDAVLRRIVNRRVSVTLLGIWSRPIRPYIPDPYGQNDEFFQGCYAAIDAYVLEVVRRMKDANPGRCEGQPQVHGNSQENR